MTAPVTVAIFSTNTSFLTCSAAAVISPAAMAVPAATLMRFRDTQSTSYVHILQSTPKCFLHSNK